MSLEEENLEDVKCFRYLGVDMASKGKAKVGHRVGEGMKVLRALRNVWKERL